MRTATCTDVVEPDDVGVDDDEEGGAIANGEIGRAHV